MNVWGSEGLHDQRSILPNKHMTDVKCIREYAKQISRVYTLAAEIPDWVRELTYTLVRL